MVQWFVSLQHQTVLSNLNALKYFIVVLFFLERGLSIGPKHNFLYSRYIRWTSCSECFTKIMQTGVPPTPSHRDVEL